MESLVQKVYYSTDSLEKESHFHDCYQVVFVQKGNVSFCVNEATYGAGPNDVAIFSRYEDHAVHAADAGYARYVLQLDPYIVNHIPTLHGLLTDRPRGFRHVFGVSCYAEALEHCFQMLMHEQANDQILGEEISLSLVQQLLILLLRCSQGQLPHATDELVVRIKQQLENTYSQPHNLRSLADANNISISSLSHRFRTATGTSVMEYLLRCRIANAKRMLVFTSLPIGQIVENCGFSDSSNFARTFHQHTGLTPSAFRQKYG